MKLLYQSWLPLVAQTLAPPYPSEEVHAQQKQTTAAEKWLQTKMRNRQLQTL